MNTKRTEKILKAFANKRRLEIIGVLRRRSELSVGEIADAIKLSFRATSQHLRLLESADIVDGRQEGRIVLYRLTNTHRVLIQQIIRGI